MKTFRVKIRNESGIGCLGCARITGKVSVVDIKEAALKVRIVSSYSDSEVTTEGS
jgi:hypothetical protein